MQRRLLGHIIIFPQRPERIETVMPVPLEDIITPICVIFVGSKPPTIEWLKEYAYPLIVRREKILNALQWLKANNVLYKDIIIDNDRIAALPENGILPVHVEHVNSTAADDVLTSRYDGDSPEETRSDSDSSQLDEESGSDENVYARHNNCLEDVEFSKVVITNVDGRLPSNEWRAAAVRHIKEKGGGFVEIPHGSRPVNEFCNPELFPMLYPRLFPYGIGGCEDSNRLRPLSFKRHLKPVFLVQKMKRRKRSYS
ncbi:hypothetical protein C8Q70DRAFT_1046102 [Cubamyces menziesii]|nr:hypothetical protein C8Q70DRAFT_1046102 [Cubamyces menziesii]